MKSTLLLKNILTTFLGIFLSLVVIEIMLRILGYTPWHYDKSNNPSIYRFDNELGWISKSGKFSMSVSKSNKDIFEMTIEDDSSRKIYGNPAENKILFLGSSCIYPKFAKQPIKEEYLLTGPLEDTNEPYAVAKIAGIKLCESYNRQYGRDYRSVMPTNLYGPNDNFHPTNSHVIPGLINRFHHASENNEKDKPDE